MKRMVKDVSFKRNGRPMEFVRVRGYRVLRPPRAHVSTTPCRIENGKIIMGL